MSRASRRANRQNGFRANNGKMMRGVTQASIENGMALSGKAVYIEQLKEKYKKTEGAINNM